MNNTSLLYALSRENTNIGTVRETFFLSQFLTNKNAISLSSTGDFKIGNYTFEIGGKNKKTKQIEGVPSSFVVKDEIENSHLNQLPLWLFGMMY